MKRLGISMLVFGVSVAGGLVLLPHRASQAQGTQHGVLIRAILATPLTLQAGAFDPGPPIAEADLKKEEDLLAVLEQLNPGWAFESLGRTVGQGADQPGDSETPNFSGHAEVVRGIDTQDRQVDAVLKIQAVSHHPAALGLGIASENFLTRLPPDQAHLIATLRKEGSPAQVVVFATILSPSGLANVIVRPTQAASLHSVRPGWDGRRSAAAIHAKRETVARRAIAAKSRSASRKRLAKVEEQ
jgi:hypothetical protein